MPLRRRQSNQFIDFLQVFVFFVKMLEVIAAGPVKLLIFDDGLIIVVNADLVGVFGSPVFCGRLASGFVHCFNAVGNISIHLYCIKMNNHLLRKAQIHFGIYQL